MGKRLQTFRRAGRDVRFVTFLSDIHPMSEPQIPEFALEKLRAGDRAEFARLVDAYSGLIYRLGLRMLGNGPDAEDVLQNTFVNALTHMAEFEGRSSLSTWLYRIASNEALMMMRRRRPEVDVEEASSDDALPQVKPIQFVDWSALPEDELLSEEGRQAVERAIQELPEPMRLVFVLRDMEGLSIQETAEALSLTEVNVKTRLLRARLRLRELLSSYYSERLIHEGNND